MTVYTPTYSGTVTRYVFIESPDLTPGDLAIRAYEFSQGLMIKETCFGLQITGQPSEVDGVIEKLRAIDPAHIFVKDRGFPPGDARRCRANLGGARPGFFGHEFEMGIIRYISQGLLALPARDPAKRPAPPVPGGTGGLDIGRLMEIIDNTSHTGEEH